MLILIPTLDGKRAAAIEVLINSPRIADLILKGEIHAIKEVMDKSENMGMQTFDGALHKLYRAERISLDEALRNADSQNNLRLKISLEEADIETALESNSLSLAGDEPEPDEKSPLSMKEKNDQELSYQERLARTIK